MNIGKKIMEIRKEHNLSQEDLANMFFVTRQTISSWECGKSYPDIETIIKISDKFNISLDKLLKGDVKMVKKIDKKVRLNKYLIITLIILLIVAIPIGIYGYKKTKELKSNSVISNIPDGYTVVDFDLDEFSFSEDLKVGDYLDYYVNIKEFENIEDIPLYRGIEIKMLRDENNENVKDIKEAKHLIVSVPDSEFKTLMIISAMNENSVSKEIKKSKNNSLKVNHELRDKILNKIAVTLDGE